MRKAFESETSSERRAVWRDVPGWLKVGAVAAASALAGGLAAAWFYKRTLSALQHAETMHSSSDYENPEKDTDDTI